MALKRWFWLFIFVSLNFSLIAQSLTEYRGVILDAATGEPLPGATVRIQGTTTGTVADNQGRFRIQHPKSGSITIELNFIGYAPLTVTKEVQEWTGALTFRLTPAAVEMEAVKITGNAGGQVKALLDQKLAANIKSIVSSEQISQFPDLNAAEVLQRIPGITLQRDQGEGKYVQLRGTPPEYTSFNVNGEQIPSPEGKIRYVGMDIIPADQIEFIEVTKVLTPDMDADAIGGTVNIVTKTAKSEIPEISVSGSAGINYLRNTGNYQLQMSYAQRKNRLGFSMNASTYTNHQGSDNLEFEYDKLPYRGTSGDGADVNYHLLYTELQLRHYTITRKRTAVSGTLDYTFGDTYLYIKGMYNYYSDHETRRRKIYSLEDPVNDSYFTYAGIDHDLKDRTKNQGIRTLNIGGRNPVGKGILDYEAAYSLASEDQPNRMEVAFEDPEQSMAIKVDKNDPDWPRVYFPNTSDSLAAYDYNNYEFDELQLFRGKIRDQNMTLKLNIEYPVILAGKFPVSFKTGGKIRVKNKEQDNYAQLFGNFRETSTIYTGTAPPLNLTTVTDDFKETNLLGQGYVMSHMPGNNKMREFYESYPQHFIFSRKETIQKSNEEDYTADETIFAVYGMFKADINKLMVLGGLRYEQTDIRYTARTIDMQGSTFNDIVDSITDKRSFRFFLPQIQLKYRFSDRLSLRAAATRSFSRPGFEDVLPYRQQDRDQLQYGNPNLLYPVSLNFDLFGEYYFQKNSILSAGLFAKEIDNFIFFYVVHGYESDPTTGAKKYIIELPMNGQNARVFGSELLSQFKLDFLPWHLKNLGIYANYTFTWSNASIYKRYPANEQIRQISLGDDYQEFFNNGQHESITLPGQAMHTLNLAIFYESKRLYTKISANYHDAFLERLGADKDLDEYYDAAWHVDLTCNYSISEHVKLFADVINLTNAPLRFYTGYKANTMKQEYYSWWGRIGLKLDL